MLATNTKVENNKAKIRGGALSVTNPSNTLSLKTSITFDKCPNLRMNRADYGGFAYYDNQYVSLKFFDSEIKNHTAYKRSGFLETKNIDNLELTRCHLTDTYAPETASMHSTAKTLKMKFFNSKVYCDLKFIYSDSFGLINVTNTPRSTHNTKFYIEAA